MIFILGFMCLVTCNLCHDVFTVSHEKQIDSLNAPYSYIEKQLDSLKSASEPKKDEVNKLKELDRIISAEQAELEKLVKCSSDLKERVSART